MNVEMCFLTNACQAGLPNLTKFNQTVHLADESRRRERQEYAGFLFSSAGGKNGFNELVKYTILSYSEFQLKIHPN